MWYAYKRNHDVLMKIIMMSNSNNRSGLQCTLVMYWYRYQYWYRCYFWWYQFVSVRLQMPNTNGYFSSTVEWVINHKLIFIWSHKDLLKPYGKPTVFILVKGLADALEAGYRNYLLFLVNNVCIPKYQYWYRYWPFST